MQTPDWLDSLNEKIDAMDAKGFASFLSPAAEFRMGNAPAVKGQDNIQQAVAGFFTTIKGLQHTILTTVSEGDTTVCRGEVTYTRLDGSQLTLPFMNFFKLNDDLIQRYLVYIDLTPLYAAGA